MSTEQSLEKKAKEWRYFCMSPQCQEREKALFRKYNVDDTASLIMKMEIRARCMFELLKRIEPDSPLPASCITQFCEEFKILADMSLGLQEIVYGDGLQFSFYPLTSLKKQ